MSVRRLQPGQAMLLSQEGFVIIANEAAELPCGCACWIGARSDNQDVAVSGVPCGDDHMPLMSTFLAALHESLDNPTNRRLVDVCDELLEEAAKEKA